MNLFPAPLLLKSGILASLCVRSQFRSIYKFSDGGKKLLDRLRRQRELDRFKKKIITIPNVLTLSRLACAPLFPWLITHEQPVYAFGLLISYGITDMVRFFSLNESIS